MQDDVAVRTGLTGSCDWAQREREVFKDVVQAHAACRCCKGRAGTTLEWGTEVTRTLQGRATGLAVIHMCQDLPIRAWHTCPISARRKVL